MDNIMEIIRLIFNNGFWFFIIFAIWLDYRMFMKGYDGIFFEHKTEGELEIQKIIIDRMKPPRLLNEASYGKEE